MLIHKNPGRVTCLAKDIHVICDILTSIDIDIEAKIQYRPNPASSSEFMYVSMNDNK